MWLRFLTFVLTNYSFHLRFRRIAPLLRLPFHARRAGAIEGGNRLVDIVIGSHSPVSGYEIMPRSGRCQ